MPIEPKGIFSNQKTRAEIFAGMPNGMRAVTTDELIQRLNDGTFITFKANSYTIDGVTFLYNDLQIKDLVAQQAQFASWNGTPYNQTGNETPQGFTNTSLIGMLNELKTGMTSDTLWNVNLVGTKLYISPHTADIVGVNQGIIGVGMDAPIAVGESGNLTVNTNFSARSIIGCLNECFRPSALYYDKTQLMLFTFSDRLSITRQLKFDGSSDVVNGAETKKTFMQFDQSGIFSNSGDDIGFEYWNSTAGAREMHLGSSRNASQAMHYINRVWLRANEVIIKNNDFEYNLFDAFNVSNLYPNILYAENNAVKARVFALADLVSVDTELQVVGINNAGVISYLDMGALKLRHDNNTYKLFSVQSGDKIQVGGDASPIAELILKANVITIVNGTETYNLFDMFPIVTYPNKLWTSPTNSVLEAKTTQVESSVPIKILNSATINSRNIYKYFGNWIEGTNSTSAYKYVCEFDTTGYAGLRTDVEMNFGTNQAITTKASMIGKITLRAQEVRVQNGDKDINIFDLATASGGLTKSFREKRTVNSLTLATTTEILVTFETEEYDDGNNFSTSTNKFTVTEAKIHIFTASLLFNLAAGGNVFIRMYKNNTKIKEESAYLPTAGVIGCSISFTGKMSVGDVIEVRAFQTSGYTGSILASEATSFEGSY